MSSVRVTFDFPNGVATLTGLGNDTITSAISLNNARINGYSKMAVLEYPLGNSSKWIFTWELYGNCEQFFRFEQYLSLLNTGRPVPRGYNPWTTMASWSYISNPSKGTIQTDTIYRNFYHSDQFPEINDIVFEIIGSPVKDWNTNESTDGYWH